MFIVIIIYVYNSYPLLINSHPIIISESARGTLQYRVKTNSIQVWLRHGKTRFLQFN